MRNWLTEWSIQSFKIEKINEIIKEKNDRKFIVIFDNSDASINLAEEINLRFPKNVVAIYLRQVQNKKLPLGATGFYTAFDIAQAEYEQGRLNIKDVTQVAEAVLNQQDIKFLIPTYATCPAKEDPCGFRSTVIKDICAAVNRHVNTLCKH